MSTDKREEYEDADEQEQTDDEQEYQLDRRTFLKGVGAAGGAAAAPQGAQAAQDVLTQDARADLLEGAVSTYNKIDGAFGNWNPILGYGNNYAEGAADWATETFGDFYDPTSNTGTEDEKQAKIHEQAVSIASSLDTNTAGRRNFVEYSRSIAMSKARVDAFKELNAGSSKSTTKTSAKNAADQFLSDIQRNTLVMEEEIILRIKNFLENIASSGVAYDVKARPAAVGAKYYDPQEIDGISPSDANIVVAADGTGDYTDLSTGLANATSGDTVFIKAGQYSANADGNSPNITVEDITIIGAGGGSVEITVGSERRAFSRDINNVTTSYSITIKGVTVFGGKLYNGYKGSNLIEYNTVADYAAADADGTAYTPSTDTYRFNYVYGNNRLLNASESTNSEPTREDNVVGLEYTPFNIDATTFTEGTSSISLYDSGTYDATTLTVTNANDGTTVPLYDYTTSGVDWELIGQPPTSSFDPAQLWNADQWDNVYDKLDGSQSYAQTNIETLVDNVFAEFSSGDRDPTTILQPTDVAQTTVGDYSEGGGLSAAQAQLALYGFNTDLEAQVKLDLKQNDDLLDGTADVSGVLVSEAVPSTTDADGNAVWKVGTKYDPANYGEPVYYLETNSDDEAVVKEITASFVIVEAQNPDTGESLDSLEGNSYDFADASNNDIKKADERSQIVVDTSDRDKATAGGGGGAGGGEDLVPLVLGALGLYGLYKYLIEDDGEM